jgi:hypothetical protein
MSEEQQAVEASQPAATDDGVEKDQSAPAGKEEDLLKALEEKDAEIARLAKEKDNYKRGLLVAKGKLPEDDYQDGEDVEVKMRRIVQEELINSQLAKTQAEKDNVIRKMAKQNEELRLAVKNRTQVNSANSVGFSNEEPEVKKEIWSKDQLEQFKSIGDAAGIKLDPSKVAENYKKYLNSKK